MNVRLRDQNVWVRIGLTGLIGALALGLWASLAHLSNHYERRDGAAGLTIDDIRAAYRGIDAPSPLVTSLRDGHPEELPVEERDVLLRWLESNRVTEDFDALELGDAAPAEIISRSCLSCHSRSASPPADQLIARDLPLDYWDDVRAIAFARQIPATPREIVIMSMHAHALTMAVMTMVVGALALATCWPRGLTGALIAVAGVSLFADLVSWLLAPVWEPAIGVIVGSGAAYNIANAALLVMILVELWRPRGSSKQPGAGL